MSTDARRDNEPKQPTESVAWLKWKALSIDSPKNAQEARNLARELRKEKHYHLAIEICDAVLAKWPRDRRVAIERCWSIYHKDVKNGDIDQMLRAAEQIVATCGRMENYTPYTITVLRLARTHVENEDEAEAIKALEWLGKIDEEKLEDVTLDYRDFENNLRRWSQRRGYNRTKLKALELTGRFEESLPLYLRFLRLLKDTNTDHREVCDELYKATCAQYDARGTELVHKLLKERGFQDASVREHYLNALYLDCGGIRVSNYQRSKQGLYSSSDSSGYNKAQMAEWALEARDSIMLESEYVTAAMTHRIQEELLAEALDAVALRDNSPQSTAVTAVADFTFCPASAAIHGSFDTPAEEAAEIGTSMHERQLLVTKRKRQLRDGFQRFARKEIRALDLDDADTSAIDPLLTDIQSAELVTTGHGKEERLIFRNSAKDLMGSPDYVFERPNRSRFVVEEKFSLSRRDQEPPQQAFLNHKMQVALYMTQFAKIEAAEGFIVHWYYSVDEDGGCFIQHATLLRLVKSREMITAVDRAISAFSEFKAHGEMPFRVDQLNPKKCVRCVCTKYCQHKTGCVNMLRFPYREFQPKNVIQANDAHGKTTFDSFAEASAAAKRTGMTLTRAPNGKGFILKSRR